MTDDIALENLTKDSSSRRYRRNGIQHVEECNEFEVARARRDKKKENKKKGVWFVVVGLRVEREKGWRVGVFKLFELLTGK